EFRGEDYFERQPGMVNDLVNIEGNRVVLKNMIGNRFPVVCGDENVSLYLNGQPVSGSIILTDTTQLTFAIKDKAPESNIEIEITSSKMRAYLKISQKPGVKYRPVLLPPPGLDEDVLISTEEDEEIPATPITEEEVLQKLAEKRITYGLKKEAVKKAVDNPGTSVLVAEGTPPVPSVDGYIDYIFEQKMTEQPVDPSGRVDHYRSHSVVSCKKGEILAVKHPPIPGKPGRNIFNEEVIPPAPADPEWRVGDGVLLIEENAIAHRSGRPMIKDGRLTVLPVYSVDADLDLSVGNIDFHGDVIINGNVQDNFEIKATGMVKVAGNVTQALIEADGQVEVVKNIIGSRVIAGGVSTYYQEVSFYLFRLKELLDQTETALKQVLAEKASQEKGQSERLIIQLLLDSKYQDIVEIANILYQIEDETTQEKTVPELRELLSGLRKKIKPTGLSHIEDMEELSLLSSQTNKAYEIIKRMDFSKAHVQAAYIQSSEVKAGGNIVVTKRGVYNSLLVAGGNVILQGDLGIFRGGVIQAHGDVYAKELGSPGWSKVVVQTEPGRTITAQKVYANVVIKIGDRAYKFDDNDTGIRARLDTSGKLLLH
ncbi:MAG: DUF342 domain-containing protein, partial [Clostridia bacterium]|nr:DUF342 domain-containing protein [Clostridia bacterium]